MDLKPRNKVGIGFSMSSMTDFVFLLLIFFMILSTMVDPDKNVLKLLLPQSTPSNEAPPKNILNVGINKDLQYAINDEFVDFLDLELELRKRLGALDNPIIKLNADKRVPIEEVVKVMTIAKDNKYRLILATKAIREQ